MQKCLAFIFIVFNLFFSFGQNNDLQSVKQDWTLMMQKISYIDSICDKPYFMKMAISGKSSKVKEKSTAEIGLEFKHKTKVFHRKGIIYSKDKYFVDRNQKIKTLTLNGEIILVKSKSRDIDAKFNIVEFPSMLKQKLFFIKTGEKQYMVTNKLRRKIDKPRGQSKVEKKKTKVYLNI